MKKLYFNGDFVPMTGEGDTFEALLVADDGTIAFTGSIEEARAQAEDAEEIDLNGACLMPGLIDPHSHISGCTQYIVAADLNGAADFDEIVERLAAFAEQRGIGEDGVIMGVSYDQNSLAEHEHPNRHVLDRVSETIPVIAVHASSHMVVANTKLLELAGITCEEMKDETSRKLIFVNEELKLKFFLAKASDVPTYVEYGAADIGVVGKDTILEEGRNLYEVMDLGIGKCRMCVAGPASARERLKHHELIRVASKYPVIAKDYFYNKKHQTVEIIKLNGSVELAPIVGLSEVIVDIVETGTTLKENGLEVLEEICPLSARVVVNQVSMKMENERINKILAGFKTAVEKRK